jgi:hypothetical protein
VEYKVWIVDWLRDQSQIAVEDEHGRWEVEGSKDIFYQIMAYSLSNIVRYSVRYPVVFRQ